MKFRGGKKKPAARTLQRQRLHSTWEKPTAFSYHAQRSERAEATGRQQSHLANDRQKMLSAQFWARRSGVLVITVAIIVCAISIVTLSTKPRVVLLDASGSQAFHATSEYQQAASDYLSTSIWNKNKVTVNTGAASTDLQKRYPELASVTIALPLIGHRPVYYLRANAPAFVLQSVNGTYVLDASGKALLEKDATASTVSGNLPVIVDQTGLHVQLGDQAISSENTQFIRTVVATLASQQLKVTSLVLPTGAAQELDVQIDGKPYVVKFNMHDSKTARQQAGTYLATAKDLAGDNITPSQYIDVRVLGRAYYQ